MKKFLLALFVSATTLLTAAPKAVVFDFGGVLCKPRPEAVAQFIQKTFSLSNEEFERVNQERRLAVGHGSTDEEFWASYAKTKGIPLSTDWKNSLKSTIKDSIGANAQMYALVEELQKQNISVALLSNIDQRWAKFVRDAGCYAPFTPCLLSYEIGAEKPDPKAYEILLARLQLPAADVVFIDDKLENVEAAQKQGIDAILFHSPEQLREALSERGLRCLQSSARNSQ